MKKCCLRLFRFWPPTISSPFEQTNRSSPTNMSHKSKHKIKIPLEFSKKSEGKDERRKRLISYQAPNLQGTLGSSSSSAASINNSSKTNDGQNLMSDSQRIDHNNLPYAWRRTGHGQKTDASVLAQKKARQTRVRPLKGLSSKSSSSSNLNASRSSPNIGSKSTNGRSVMVSNSRVSVGTEASAPPSPPSKHDEEATKTESSDGPQRSNEAATVASSSPPPLKQVNATLLPAPLGIDEPVPGWWDQPSFTRLDQSRMPLEAFDDVSLEYNSTSATPTQWLKKCRTGKVQYYSEGEWQWRKVVINSYNNDTYGETLVFVYCVCRVLCLCVCCCCVKTFSNNQFLFLFFSRFHAFAVAIVCRNKFNVTFDGPTERPTRLSKDVRRLDLMFTDEDRELFLSRRNAAKQYREDFKASLRLRTFIDNVYVSERVNINTRPSDAVMARIIDSAHGGANQAKQARADISAQRKREAEDGDKISGPTLAESLIVDVKKRYERAQGKSSLTINLQRNVDLKNEFIESRLPLDMLPENR